MSLKEREDREEMEKERGKETQMEYFGLQGSDKSNKKKTRGG